MKAQDYKFTCNAGKRQVFTAQSFKEAKEMAKEAFKTNLVYLS